MSEKCFCHLNGYAVKDATARKDIERLNTLVNNNLLCNIISMNGSINNSVVTTDTGLNKTTEINNNPGLSDYMLENIQERRNVNVNIANFKKAGFNLKKVEISLTAILSEGSYAFDFTGIVSGVDKEFIRIHNISQTNLPTTIGVLKIKNYDDLDITLNFYNTFNSYSDVIVNDIVLYYDRSGSN